MHADLTQWIRPESSLSGKAWRWRGGNMDMAQTAAGGLSDDIITQLLLARGVAREDLSRHVGCGGRRDKQHCSDYLVGAPPSAE